MQSEFASAMCAAVAANDLAAETAIIRMFHSTQQPPGRYHEKIPMHWRLLSRVVFGMNDCWIWCGPTNGQGYGRFSVKNRTEMAHRISYETFKGIAIPEGMSVLHTCDNPSCINPNHLFVGTYSDNRRDCLAKGRWKITKKRSVL